MAKDDVEDLYNIRRPSIGLYIILAIIVVALVGLWYVSAMDKPAQKKAFMNDCEDIMLRAEKNNTICCVDGGNAVDCADKQPFKYGDYIIAEANLALLNNIFPAYYACMLYTPLETTIAGNWSRAGKVVVGSEEAVCSGRLTNVYQHAENQGLIKTRGKITVMKIYIFPPLGFNTTQQLVNNLNRGILVLDIKANVE